MFKVPRSWRQRFKMILWRGELGTFYVKKIELFPGHLQFAFLIYTIA